MESELLTYDQAARIQGELDTKKAELSAERSVRLELERVAALKDADIQSKDDQLGQKERELASLRSQLQSAQQKFNEQKDASGNLEELLQRSHADTEQAIKDRERAEAERDNIEYRQQQAEIELEELRAEWDEQQEKIEELKGLEEHAHQLQNQIEQLNEDLEGQQEAIAQEKRRATIKDDRIAHLERELQRAHLLAANAQAAAEVVSSPTAPPTFMPPTGGESLFAELEKIDDEPDTESDSGAESQHSEQAIGFSTLSTIDIKPIKPATTALAFSPQTVTDIAPVQAISTKLAIYAPHPTVNIEPTEPIKPAPTQLSTSSTQTEPAFAKLSISLQATINIEPIELVPVHLSTSSSQTLSTHLMASGTQTEHVSAHSPTSSTQTLSTQRTSVGVQTNPKLNTWFIQLDEPSRPTDWQLEFGTIADLEPREPIEAKSASTQTKFVSRKSKSTQTGIPQPSKLKPILVQGPNPDITGIRIKEPARKFGFIEYPWYTLAIILFLMFIYFGFQVRMWHNVNYIAQDNWYGAYGAPGYFFRIIPFGWDIGESAFSQIISKYVTGAIQHLEGSLGIDNVPFH
ncbi:hypothetical protein CC78DRAFT_249561 [Lojkania enalia]|uniref:Uncharacterized protein n=1 Tax=Lojkania enalia TaxID=147567 RepID=A0A9P4K9B8_9PLEO|nr:hypothetical protein CC78DRAFT_249561 [Didymosphaeria enalia]